MAPRRRAARVSCGTSTTARHRADELWSLTWCFPRVLRIRRAISVGVSGRSKRRRAAALVGRVPLNLWPRPLIAFVISDTVDVITDYSQDEIRDHFVDMGGVGRPAGGAVHNHRDDQSPQHRTAAVACDVRGCDRRRGRFGVAGHALGSAGRDVEGRHAVRGGSDCGALVTTAVRMCAVWFGLSLPEQRAWMLSQRRRST
jgi:hypothetical protein